MGQQLTTRSRVVCLQEKLKVELQEEGTHNTQLLHHPETVNPTSVPRAFPIQVF